MYLFVYLTWAETKGKGHTWTQQWNTRNTHWWQMQKLLHSKTTLCLSSTLPHGMSEVPLVSHKPRPRHNAAEVNNWQRIIMESLNVHLQRRWLMCRVVNRISCYIWLVTMTQNCRNLAIDTWTEQEEKEVNQKLVLIKQNCHLRLCSGRSCSGNFRDIMLVT